MKGKEENGQRRKRGKKRERKRKKEKEMNIDRDIDSLSFFQTVILAWLISPLFGCSFDFLLLFIIPNQKREREGRERGEENKKMKTKGPSQNPHIFDIFNNNIHLEIKKLTINNKLLMILNSSSKIKSIISLIKSHPNKSRATTSILNPQHKITARIKNFFNRFRTPFLSIHRAGGKIGT